MNVLQYPRDGVWKVPNYVSTWVKFEDGRIVDAFKSKPTQRDLDASGTFEISASEEKRYVSCFSTTSYREWLSLHDVSNGFTVIEEHVSREYASKGYWTVGGFNREERVLHREVGPAVINSDGSKEWWSNGFIERKEYTTGKTEKFVWKDKFIYEYFVNNVYKGIIDTRQPSSMENTPQKQTSESSDSVSMLAVLAVAVGAVALSSKKRKKVNKHFSKNVKKQIFAEHEV